MTNDDRLAAAYQKTLNALLAERNDEGFWTGELSSSALATATAICALSIVSPLPHYSALITQGRNWLVDHQNADGGWGDTVKSISNISTSMLVRAAFYLAGGAQAYSESLRRLDAYLSEHCGRTPEELAEAVRARYGKDRTFAVPILMTCALAGLVEWKEVAPLPFELACLPQSWFRFLRLPVVSYALPALIAVGQAVFHHRPPRNPLTRLLRRLARGRSLHVLERIQPSSGGFLEAIPLTSFVVLGLASIGQGDHPVAHKGVEFLARSVRPDGSWPIDSNLSVWVTTLAVNALAAAGELESLVDRDALLDWLLAQQTDKRHPYTGAKAGGWGWTHLPGSVPDADDTAGAILALSNLSKSTTLDRALTTAQRWLESLQNNDYGMPTFCHGWGRLPFDRSGCDLTAHAVRAFVVGKEFRREINYKPSFWSLKVEPAWVYLAAGECFNYLEKNQRPDGSWVPLWFGNQHAPKEENPTYGTARVLAAYRDMDMMNTEPARRGVAWLLSAQNSDGGWGGAAGVPSSVEETALAVEILLDAPGMDIPGSLVDLAVKKGLAWLVEQVEAGGLEHPTPIGFYFAKLWYFEKLYPIIFNVAALGRACKKLPTPRNPP